MKTRKLLLKWMKTLATDYVAAESPALAEPTEQQAQLAGAACASRNTRRRNSESR